jgi:hypothetical protein
MVLLSAMALGDLARAQAHAEDHGMTGGVPLHPTAKVAIPTEASRPIYKPAKCDAHGDIYFRAYQTDDRRVPVVRADGKGITTRYSLDAETEFARATSYDFSILPDGSLYEPVQVGQDVYIVTFDKQGEIRRRIKLEKKFWASRLAALNDHIFLVIGTEPQAVGRQQPPQPVIALFDDQGRLVRNVNLEPSAPKDRDDTPGEHPGVLAVLSSDAQVTADGVLYLMLHTNPVLVYRLDLSGTVAPPLKVRPPGARMTAVSMSAIRGRLAVLFRESFRGMQHDDTGTIVIIDTATGAETGRYTSGGLGTTLACYKPDDFVFLASENDKLAIQHASPH